MLNYLPFSDDSAIKEMAAERFVSWLNSLCTTQARGDELIELENDPLRRFWLGRLGPKDLVTRSDERGDRLEPCAIGIKLLPKDFGPWALSVKTSFCIWRRERDQSGKRIRSWRKEVITHSAQFTAPKELGDYSFCKKDFEKIFSELDMPELCAEVRVRVAGRGAIKNLEVTLVNTSPGSIEPILPPRDLCDGRFFEVRLSVSGIDTQPFELEALPDSFRYNRSVDAFGINCGYTREGDTFATSDGPTKAKNRPNYWAIPNIPCPDFSFQSLSADAAKIGDELLNIYGDWFDSAWSKPALDKRALEENWSAEMRATAEMESKDAELELNRMRLGCDLLKTDYNLREAFSFMNRAMIKTAREKYSSWRPFQFGFLLANLNCIVNPEAENEIVDIVWFATGGGKTETYLGLLLTAAFFDRLRGKLSGITAWSRFPLRMLSLQQTQRFANALASAELIRIEENVPGDEFSLGFLVGASATPNRIKKESDNPDEDADKIDDRLNPFLLLETCPFCRSRGVKTELHRATWRLVHICDASDCPSDGRPLPIYVVDEEIWRFLPTIVIGTLDKAANVARSTGMRGLIGSPWGMCTKPGHGYTYAPRSVSPNGCLVPDCRGGSTGPLPIQPNLYGPSFRLQDELHLLRDSLGAVDAHYESCLDELQFEITGMKPKILASSATLTGYNKQADALYKRKARVFPQPSPKDGSGFWTSDSTNLMRRFLALAPRGLTVEYALDTLLVSLQTAIRQLNDNPEAICSELKIDSLFSTFLVDIYGTNVVYGNNLQDLDAAVRSAEILFTSITPPPCVESLTGRVGFEEVRLTLDRLENDSKKPFTDRIHIVAASSMMSHGVDIDRLNIMVMISLPLNVAEFIQATARVGRKWPAIVIVLPKMTRERDASIYRTFPEFISHGDRFVEPIPITRKSRRVLEQTISGLAFARIAHIHELQSNPIALTTPRNFNSYMRQYPNILNDDKRAMENLLGITAADEMIRDQLDNWYRQFGRNLQEPGDTRFLSELSPTGQPMTSLRDVEEQVPVKGYLSR